MGLGDAIAIAAAERVERTGGPRAGLFAWRKLADASTSAELRGKALLAAMRCALALPDPSAMLDLARLWPTVVQGVWETQTIAVCKDALRAGMTAPAVELAEAEARRSGTARAIYAYARVLDVAHDTRAARAFEDAADRADKEGAAEMARSARIRRAAWLARAPDTRLAAIDLAKSIDARGARPDERIVLGRILLGASSRFVRATGIGLLDDVVSSDVAAGHEPGPFARRALRLAAQYADDRGDSLSPMELDRLLALFGREPVRVEAARAREALRARDAVAKAKDDQALATALDAAASAVPELAPLHLRARLILAGRPPPPSDGAIGDERSAWSPWSLLLDAAQALREGAPDRAALALRRLAAQANIPAQAWTIAELALVGGGAELHDAAAQLVSALLLRRGAPPARGWLAITSALAAAGLEDLAARTLRSAALAAEPGAEEALALALTRAGWQHARAGDRARALAELREAKAMAERRGANRST